MTGLVSSLYRKHFQNRVILSLETISILYRNLEKLAIKNKKKAHGKNITTKYYPLEIRI